MVLDKQLVKKSGRFVLQSKHYQYIYKNDKTLSEDAVWEKDIKKHFNNVPKNVKNIWIYGFLEMFNNAMEHSKGKTIRVVISENNILSTIFISDDGIGIFKNIKASFNLINEKDALLELAKGKRTTQRSRHSGQGIFFTSKAFDDFWILSNEIIYKANPTGKKPSKIVKHKYSTLVYMCLYNNSSKILKNVFDNFSTEIPGDFDKTCIPITLANSDDLVSRSQARRVLSGLELFKEVTLDFKDIEYIGQAFADEIFRVFPNMNSNTKITVQNANENVQNMINRAINTKL